MNALTRSSSVRKNKAVLNTQHPMPRFGGGDGQSSSVFGNKAREIVPVKASQSIAFSTPEMEEIEAGIKSVVTIEGQLDEHITDLAGEFSEFCRSEIWTMCHVFSMHLKDSKSKNSIQMSLMESALSKLKTMARVSRPFTRFERLDMIYTPLFENVGFKNPPMVSIALHDESMGKDLQKVEFLATEMHLLVFGMNYCIRAQDAKFIKIKMNANNIPVKGRDWGVIYTMVHIDTSSFSGKVQGNDPTCVLLEDAERPKNMNKKNVIEAAARSLERMSDKKKARIEQKNSDMKEKKNESVIILGDSGTNEPGESSNSQEIVMLTHNSAHLKPTDWVLDGGASMHIILEANVQEPDSLVLADGSILVGRQLKSTVVSLNGRLITLKPAFSSSGISCNILSEGKLFKDGVVDSKKVSGKSWVLSKGDAIILKGKIEEDNLFIIG